MEQHCHHCESSSIKLGKKLKIVGGIFLGILALSYLPALSSLQTSLFSYLKLIWWAVLLGLFIGGLIDHFIPDQFIQSKLGGKKIGSLYNAVLAGFLLSACSHGILAISIQLYKKGAGIPAVITFLLASPWANLPVTILLFSFFGWKAGVIVLTAMLIALITGHIFLVLEKFGLIEKSKYAEVTENYSFDHIRYFNFKKSVVGVTQGAVSLANMVLWWILIGVMLAALIGAYVPSHWFMQYFGPTFTGLLLTLVVATFLEVCSEGTAPLAFEIFNKVGTIGNPFVFLMAGVVTDYTEIGLLWTNVGKKTAIWLPIVAVPQVLLAGWVMNTFL